MTLQYDKKHIACRKHGEEFAEIHHRCRHVDGLAERQQGDQHKQAIHDTHAVPEEPGSQVRILPEFTI